MPYINPQHSFASSSSSDAFDLLQHPLPSAARVVGYRPVLANGMVGRRLLLWPALAPAPATPEPELAAELVAFEQPVYVDRGLIPYTIRQQIKALKRIAGWTFARIAAALDELYTTVQRVANEAATPGRHLHSHLHGLRQFGTPVANRIIDYVTGSAEGRRATYQQIKEQLELVCSVDTIRRRLNERGYFKRVAKRAPFLDADGLDLRPQFGQWCIDQSNNSRTF
ncbi:unnamed protein product [Zymoseptoria tritici ST99CH_1E4]|uniref:Transposase Tc1-like domain-containing protein n=1 Tax=Zymoseptoria tritici ST99CH_1E4 TaxID=1276532 RepID=A0A2H1GGW9_ZYMTR|nr:unnamed protein product [Zymoseptoria tritici ST99CH_1E4]